MPDRPVTPFVDWPSGEVLVLASRSPRRAELLATAGILRSASEPAQSELPVIRHSSSDPRFAFCSTVRCGAECLLGTQNSEKEKKQPQFS